VLYKSYWINITAERVENEFFKDLEKKEGGQFSIARS